MKISALVDAKKLSEFVKHRLNSDGGYTFARKLYGFEFPSSISETYYALAVLSMLGVEIPARSKTLDYLNRILEPSGRCSSISVAFYAIKSLRLLGEKISIGAALIEQLDSTIKQRRAIFEEFSSEWFSADYEVSDSQFYSVFCASSILKIAGAKMEKPDFTWIAHKERGGGFGVGSTDIVSTYHALSALSSSGYGVGNPSKTAEFVEKCVVSGGGYAMVPYGSPAFVETTYFAIASLALVGKESKARETHLHYLAGLQNANGGFKRSAGTGISTLANSYFAVKAINMLLDGGKNG